MPLYQVGNHGASIRFTQETPSDHWIIPNGRNIPSGVFVLDTDGNEPGIVLNIEEVYPWDVHVLANEPFSGTASITF